MRVKFIFSITLLCALVDSLSMPSPRPVYGVSMIVKDEIKILPRLFNSLRPYISHYEICDTGSTDGTPEWIERWLKQQHEVTGVVHRDPWVNFGANRNACLLRIRDNKRVTHILLPDADFELVVLDKEGFKERGPKYGYNYIEYVGGTTFHSQPLLIASNLRCGYMGSTHEYLLCVDNKHAYEVLMGKSVHDTDDRLLIETSHESPASPSYREKRATYSDIAFRHHHDGYNRKDKYTRDIMMLEQDIERDPNNTRSWFYLGQSYENANQPMDAFSVYSHRVKMSKITPLGDDIEAWYSLYRMGVCFLNNGTKFIKTASEYFLKAYNVLPTRREPLFPLVHSYRVNEQYVLCKMYGTEALTVPFPAPPTKGSALFNVEKRLYEWAFVDEVSICLHELGDNASAERLLGSILNNRTKFPLPSLPDDERERLEKNLKAFRQRSGSE